MSPPDALLVPQPTVDEFPEFVSIPIRIARHAKAFPGQRAVVCEGKTRTWRQFDKRINQVAHALAGMGVGKGDKIAILAANSVEYLETFMAGLRVGACVVPLSTMAAGDALEKMLDDSDAKVLFLSDQYRDLVEEHLRQCLEGMDGPLLEEKMVRLDGGAILLRNEGGVAGRDRDGT